MIAIRHHQASSSAWCVLPSPLELELFPIHALFLAKHALNTLGFPPLLTLPVRPCVKVRTKFASCLSCRSRAESCASMCASADKLGVLSALCVRMCLLAILSLRLRGSTAGCEPYLLRSSEVETRTHMVSVAKGSRIHSPACLRELKTLLAFLLVLLLHYRPACACSFPA